MLDFPNSPSVNQVFSAPNGVTWIWDGVKWPPAPATIVPSAGGPYLPLAGGSMSGAVQLAGVSTAPTASPGTSTTQIASTGFVAASFAPLASPAMTGTPTAPTPAAADNSTNVATTAWVQANALYGDNRIINGDMRIDQRNNGASGTAINVYTVDRWAYYATQASKGTWKQSGGAGGSGFQYCLSFTSSSAYTPLAADYFSFWHPIEADQIGDFMWGTANAQPVTLSFWVQSSITGTFSGAIQNYAETRCYPFSYSIPTANAYTKIVITIPGDSGGSWVMSGNGGALYLIFDLGSGATRRGSAGAWATTTSPGYTGATGAVSVVATNGATFYVTGVKLEVGSVATPFNRQSLAKSMADCQRYYQKLGGAAAGDIMVQGYSVSTGSGNAVGITIGTIAMRAVPAAALVGTWTINNVTTWNLFPGISTLGFNIVPGAAGAIQMYTAGTSTYVTLNAEL